MNYLVDTSALVRILRRQVEVSWHDQVTHGMVAICDPVLTEALTIARTSEYQRVRADLPEIVARGSDVPVGQSVGRTYRHANGEVLIEGDPLPVRLLRSRSAKNDW